jgi:hypothetical protein
MPEPTLPPIDSLASRMLAKLVSHTYPALDDDVQTSQRLGEAMERSRDLIAACNALIALADDPVSLREEARRLRLAAAAELRNQVDLHLELRERLRAPWRASAQEAVDTSAKAAWEEQETFNAQGGTGRESAGGQ